MSGDPRNPKDDVRARLEEVPDLLGLLEGLFVHAPVAYQVYRKDGRCLLTNPAHLALFGSVPPPEYNILEDDLAASVGILDHIHRAFAGETVETPPFWYDPRDIQHVRVTEGRRAAMVGTFFPLRDSAGEVTHVATAFRDVTETLLAEARAKAERDLLRAIIDQIGDGIIVADVEGRVLELNPAAAAQHGTDALGTEPEAWASTYGLERLDGTPMPYQESPLHRALHGEACRGLSWRVRRPDGEVRTMTGTSSTLRGEDGETRGAVLVTRDETERLALEAALRDKRAELELAIAARDAFLSSASHELRTPLTALLLQLDRLTRLAQRASGPIDPSSLTASVGSLRRQAHRLDLLVDRMLDVSRLASGQMTLHREPVDLGDAVREVVAAMADEASHLGVTVEVEGGPGATAYADHLRVLQILRGLIGNAMQYGLGRPVHVRVEAAADAARVVVRDDGPGIAAGDLQRVFERFERSVPAYEHAGLGLGLWLARGLAEAMGGRLTAESRLGAGSTFTLSLPRPEP